MIQSCSIQLFYAQNPHNMMSDDTNNSLIINFEIKKFYVISRAISEFLRLLNHMDDNL